MKMNLYAAFRISSSFAIGCVALVSSVRCADIDFNRDVRPILSENCFACHGPDGDHREADLRFDEESSAKQDLGGYRAVTAGNVEASELMVRIASPDDDLRMPPPEFGKTLTAQQIQVLRRWIEEGANWSQHWAYVDPVKRPTPAVGGSTWPQNWIDHFLLANLQRQGMQPATDADPVTLVRRLHFDLIGLPPAPQVVQDFANPALTRNQVAQFAEYQRMVDTLLESQHFGERMAMYWLDLVRYADTVGYHGDQDQSISPYRDYVIDAFNCNVPFDQFTREQLAGDLLPEPNQDQIVATGYNRLLQTSHEGGVQPKEYTAIYAADRVRNVSMVWLGGTLGCAQCHDHKYDPYTALDFYRMAAFFADVDEASHFKTGTNELPTKRAPEIAVLSRAERKVAAQLDRQIAAARQRRDGLSADSDVAELDEQLKELVARRRGLDINKRLTMITVALEEPRTVRLLPRGNWLDDSGPIVQPAVPQFLGAIVQTPTTESGQATRKQLRASRLDLANWLTDVENGRGLLTSRVFVNRVWYLFFGHGLSRSLDDFGGQGVPPDHPELLDRLAVEFVDHGWDLKWLVKQIVTSRSYRQSSLSSGDGDPENRMLARQTRFRLPAEMIRDNALAISGLLVTDIGGMSVRPYQPAGYFRHLNFPKRKYRHDDDAGQWRRGVYVHWQRQFLHPTFRALDAPSREECTTQRARSNTPLAALALLNDPSFVEAARVFASRVLAESPDDTFQKRLEYAFQLALSRNPDDFELQQLEQLYESDYQRFANAPDQARRLLEFGQSPVSDQLRPVEVAAWTSVTRTLLNLHETITRN